MIDFNHSVPQKASTVVLEAQTLISGRLICFSVTFRITSINQDLAILAEKITNVPAVFPNRMSATVKIVVVFLLLFPVLLHSNCASLLLIICTNPHFLLVAKGTSMSPIMG